MFPARPALCRLLFAGLSLLALPAKAHYLWLEGAPGDAVRLYFGEFQEQAREVAGGRLDEIRTPRAWTRPVGAALRELSPQKRADHFELRPAGNGAVLAEEAGYAVKDWSAHGYGVVKPMYYARYAPARAQAPTEPVLTLDLLPAGDGRVRVFFRARPLARAKLTLYAPNLWQREYETDAEGYVRIDTPWAGQYIAEVIHLEKQPGEFEGKSYENLRHRATLTTIRPAGRRR